MLACRMGLWSGVLDGASAHQPLHSHLRPSRVFPAPAGGPIAALRNDAKVVLYVGAVTKPDIQIFSAAGRSLGRVLWDSRARVAAAGWLAAENLLVLDDAAQVGYCMERVRWGCLRVGGPAAAGSGWPATLLVTDLPVWGLLARQRR